MSEGKQGGHVWQVEHRVMLGSPGEPLEEVGLDGPREQKFQILAVAPTAEDAITITRLRVDEMIRIGSLHCYKVAGQAVSNIRWLSVATSADLEWEENWQP